MTGDGRGQRDTVPQIWDEGLQNERTSLAWRRSTLALLGCALLVARLAARADLILGLSLAVAALVLAVAVARVTSRRYHQASAALHAGRPLPDGKVAALSTAFLLLVAAGSIALIAWTT